MTIKYINLTLIGLILPPIFIPALLIFLFSRIPRFLK
jgi:hypothetical protein